MAGGSAMSIGWQVDDLIDLGCYDGLNTGWYYKFPYKNNNIPFSKRANTLFSQLETNGVKIDDIESGVRNLEDILFINENDSPQIKTTKLELIFEWRFVTEGRKNDLIFLKNHLRFYGSKMSIDATINDLTDACRHINEIISKEPDICFSKQQWVKKDAFINHYAKELIINLLNFLHHVEDNILIQDIIFDLKYLTAFILNKKNALGEFSCAETEYVKYLRDIGLKSELAECENCCIDTTFTDYRFCLCCGKRIR